MKIKTATIFSLLLLLGSLSAQDLISIEQIGSRTYSSLQVEYGLLVQNGVEQYKVTYTTPDVYGQIDTASGLLVLPVRTLPHTYPILCYQHGTSDGKTDVPSNLTSKGTLATIWGSVGYITIAADYLGLGDSRGFHPYLHAESEAWAAIDMMKAVRTYLDDNGVLYNDQIFVSGYSQGGHAAAALQRTLERDFSGTYDVTASAPMSGPYAMADVMVDLMLGDEAYSTPAYLPNVIMGMNEAYDLGYTVQEYFKEPYASSIQQYVNGEINLFDGLNAQLYVQLTMEAGAPIPRYMLQDSIVQAVASQPDHPLLLAVADNDLTQWVPQAPTRLYYCTADDQVNYTNSVVADSIMNANGANDVMAVDVDSNGDHGACVSPAMINSILFFAAYADITVDADDVMISNDIKIYPNPTDGILYIEQATTSGQISIYDLKGRLLLQKRMDTDLAEINLDPLVTGMYILKYIGDEGSFMKKIIKN